MKPHKHPAETDSFFTDSRKRLSILVAGTGIVITLLAFTLVKEYVDRYFNEQANSVIAQTIVDLQSRINRDQYLLESIADRFKSEEGKVTPETLERFRLIAEHEQSRVHDVFLMNMSIAGGVDKNRLLALSQDVQLPLDIDDLDGLQNVIRAAQAKAQPVSDVLSHKNNKDNKWVVLARPVVTGLIARNVVVGFIPLPDLFRDVYQLYAHGNLTKVEVTRVNDPYAPAFLFLQEKQAQKEKDLAYLGGTQRVHLDDQIWKISFIKGSGSKTVVLAALPVAIALIGMLLTWALVAYLQMIRTRGREIASLARSLQDANATLKAKVDAEKRMAEALRESEQRYRAIFENASIGICQISPTGLWVNANRTMAEILGYDSPEILLSDQPDLDNRLFIDPDVRRDWFLKLENEAQREHEAALLTHHQEIVWVNMAGRAVRDARGNIMHFECTMYDVTERREAEKALMAAKEQADFANRSKSEFLANMSHELRTPLNAIIGFAEIIKDQLFGPVGQQQYVEYAKDIHDSGHLLLSLINDILDMSKIEAGKRALAEAVLSVEDTVASVIRLVSVRARTGKLHLNVEIPHNFPALRAEERAIKQILTNLLTNAIKFTPEGGNVWLRTEMSAQGEMLIKVQDTGIGMRPEDIPIALTPFGQIESALSRKYQGTGLGLPLTRALVELHGGVLDLESAPNQGTTVTLTFPADRVVPQPLGTTVS